MAKINHSNRKHALLSASGASRWMNCTPSARLEEVEANKMTSSYAKEGTLAHEFAELGVKKALSKITPETYLDKTKLLKKSEYYSQEMIDEVGKYVDAVTKSFEKARKVTKDAVIQIEERLDFSHIVENGFGTGDAVIIADGVLEVIDLKYGMGILVYAKENPQLMLYGSGALRNYELMYDIHTVRLTVAQPRRNHFDSWDISATELRNWGENTVKPRAEMAYAGEGKQVPGDWCKFCKIKPKCRALTNVSLELAKHDFAEPLTLTDEEILGVYEMSNVLSDWLKSVNTYVLDRAIEGKDWKGYKLVEGRSTRKWNNQEKVIETLKKNKFKEEDFTTKKLAGIVAIEKLVSKDKFDEMLGEYISKPQGAPTVVKDSDKRPAFGYEQAVLDFGKED